MSKLRITLFHAYDTMDDTISLHAIEDRLVEMSTEFRNGPKEKHTGPIRVEALLSNSEEVDGLITYLSQLSKDLPIPEKAQRATAKKKETPMKEDSIQELITYIKTSPKMKTQEDVIEHLRSLNFVIITMDHWDDITQSGLKANFKERHINYQVMARQLKLAKDPKNDKYDTQILFLIKFLGNRFDKIQVYVDGKYQETIPKDWREVGEIGLKVKQKFYKFPKGMDYEERAKWRTEDRKAQANPDYEGTKFYYKWLPFVKILKPQPKKK